MGDALVLFAIVVLVGGSGFMGVLLADRFITNRRRAKEPAADPALFAAVQVEVFGASTRTTILVDRAKLELLANGLGMTLVPLTTMRVQ